jgi:RNA polymerase sigma factor (TIGR02999 family)
MGQITVLLGRMHAGDENARNTLFEITYEELRRLARARLRNSGPSTGLDPTTVVHESYLRFAPAGQLRAGGHRAFFAYASMVMRSVIIEWVRKRRAERRGGDALHVELSEESASNLTTDDRTARKVHEALEVLEQADARLGRVAQMRFYEGYTVKEIAKALGITERTVQRDWQRARLLLAAELA